MTWPKRKWTHSEREEFWRALHVQPFVLSQILEGYPRLWYCPQHRLLGFQTIYDPNKWRLAGSKKLLRHKETGRHCQWRFCPTMRRVRVTHKQKQLRQIWAIAEHLKGLRPSDVEYKGYSWGFWETLPKTLDWEDLYL